MAIVNKISTCNNARCGFCVRGSLDTNVKFYANCTNKEYTVDFNVTCTTTCSIYLLTCKCCGIKYVGKTWNPLRQRFNGHRGHIRRGTEAYVMYNHFCGSGGHGISNMMIKPIELCKKEDLIKREKFWIAELNTLFPYGLNMEANFENVSDAYLLVTSNNSSRTIYSVFNKVINKRAGRGGKKRTGNRIDGDIIYNEQFDAKSYIEDSIRLAWNTSNFVHALRGKLLKLDVNAMKKVFLQIIDMISRGNLGSMEVHEYCYYVIKDICLHKLSSLHKDKHVKSKHFMVIKFANKLVEDINLKKILCNNNISSLFPVKNDDISIPSVAYRRTKNIQSKVLNYRETLQDGRYANFTCKCNNYDKSFKDEHHGHIITGDLNIVENTQLKNLLKKGLNFHEQQPPNREVAINVIKSGIDSYISKISNKLHLPVKSFVPWKTEIMRLIQTKMNNCKIYNYNKVLSNQSVKEALNKLKKDFVLAPVDKAGNNIAIVCKQYYVDIVTKEIQHSQTFAPINGDQLGVMRVLKNTGFINSDDADKLPLLYATIKMHKMPVGFRYITAGIGTVLQNLSRAVGKCLKLLLKVAHNAKEYKIKEINNCIFIIDNRDKVVKFMENVNNSNLSKRKCISTWDFATLYTKIPHDKLISNVKNFINDIFKCVKNKVFIASPINGNAYFTNSQSKTNKCFDKEQLVKVINCIVSNAYITYHGNVYRQVIGVPMGTNCAPALANIYLHQYEYKYLKSLVQNGDIETAKMLSNTFRYQDDCVALNDNGLFAEHFNKIYPKEMVLKGTNISRDKCTFLDLKISIYRGKFVYSSYDKRDDFGFEVVNFPNLSGNIPAMQSYGVYISQLVRFCDINITYKGFVKDVAKMNTCLLKQGFQRNLLKKKYAEFCKKYIHKWSKYNRDISNSF